MTPQEKHMKFTYWSGVFTVAIFLIILLWALSARAATVQVDLGWDANVETDLAGYNVYSATGTCVATPIASFTKVGASTGTTNSASVSIITTVDLTKSFRITAFDTAGNESPMSNCVEKALNVVPPVAPTGPIIKGVTITAK